MKRLILAAILAISVSAEADQFGMTCDVYFSPNGGATQAIVDAVGRAKSSVFVLAYSYTSKPIADAIIAAKLRGIDVRLIADDSQLTSNGSKLAVTIASGVETYLDRKHSIAHNKTMIIDDAYVVNGSFNFSGAAETSNGENMMICNNIEQARVFKQNWWLHQSHSVRQ